MISRSVQEHLQRGSQEFQSRNRGSFDFKSTLSPCSIASRKAMFQSRNRGSFDFQVRINGGITGGLHRFQSRNRGSFDFKLLA